MRYLKITIEKGSGGIMVYPLGYQSEIGDYSVDHLYYKDGLNTKLLLCIPDKDFSESMIRTNVEEITESEAKSISEANEQRRETITDEAKIRRIEIKTRLGQTLTLDELKAVDINDSASCFKLEKILADRINTLKSKE